MTYSRLKRPYKACKSVVLFKSQGFSEKRKYLAYQQRKIKPGRAPAEKEMQLQLQLKPLPLTKISELLHLCKFFGWIFGFFYLNLPYTYLFMLKLSTAFKVLIKKLTLN